MDILLQLDKMTTSDKLSAMEQIWDDLCKDPDSIQSPQWHRSVLKSREQQVTEGKASFYALDTAKKRIREQIE